jgi:hypothetical protein
MIWALLNSKPLQWALGALMLLGGYEAWAYHERHIGATAIVSDINQQTEQISEKAIAARSAADRPGAFQRLRSDSCVNCKAGLPKSN